jgi:hypothetical protein
MIGFFRKYRLRIWGSFADAQDDRAFRGQSGGKKWRFAEKISKKDKIEFAHRHFFPPPSFNTKCHPEGLFKIFFALLAL